MYEKYVKICLEQKVLKIKGGKKERERERRRENRERERERARMKKKGSRKADAFPLLCMAFTFSGIASGLEQYFNINVH